MKRVFAAIDISDQTRRSVTEYVSRLQDEFPGAPVRWERPEKLHITVKFAGSLDEPQLGIFAERVAGVVRSVNPFRIKIAGTGAFVKRRGPSVLWLGVEQMTADDRLGAIAAMLDSEAGRLFHPHVTIARSKDAKKAKNVIERHRASEFETVEFEVAEIVIVESKLLPSGSVYTQLIKVPLGVR